MHLSRCRTAIIVFVMTLTAAAGATSVDEQVAAILTAAAESGDVNAAAKQADELFDRVVLHAAAPQGHVFAEAAIARRLLHQLAAAQVDRQKILRSLMEAPDLARILPVLVSDKDDPTRVYALLDRLIDAAGPRLNDFAALAAAICVVHDQPVVMQVNENAAAAADPLDVFAYFVRHDEKLTFSTRNVPAELLVFVVDTTASPQEMQWALEQYAGRPNVGERFFEIEYDFDHFADGRPKAVSQGPYTLPNIKRLGGICADQAYFAAAVGKSLGIPSVYVYGRGGDTAHAWVGFLEARGGRPTWNFDAGRYDAYQGVRGWVADAQRGGRLDDSRVALLADFAVQPRRDREAAAGLTDAARRIDQWRTAPNVAVPDVPPLTGSGALPRPADLDQQLLLLESAIRACPAYAPAWDEIGRLAADGQLTLDHKRRFADALLRLCGTKYPDFAADILSSMIATIDDARQQNDLWERLFQIVSQQRKDLAAGVRLAQGRLWEREGDLDRAGRCYQHAYQRYANDGPYAVYALSAAENLLRTAGRANLLPRLYGPAWKLMHRPTVRNPTVAQQANWYQVGVRYAQVLDELGQSREARNVRNLLAPYETRRATSSAR